MKLLLRSLAKLDDGWLRLQAAAWNRNHRLRASFSIHAGRHGKPLTRWEILGDGVREYLICDADGGGLSVYSRSHPLVRQYTDSLASLRFRGPLPDPERLLSRLWHEHVAEVDDWIPLDRYLPTPAAALRLFSTQRGLLSRGPHFLLKRYARCLKAAGARPQLRIVRGQQPTMSAIHFGNSYIVAKRFVATPALANYGSRTIAK